MLADGDPFWFIYVLEDEEAATWGKNGEMERLIELVTALCATS